MMTMEEGSLGNVTSTRDPAVAVTGARFAYGDIVAVWDVSFQVNQGEGLLIQGSNGAGKTTTLRGVAGLLTPRAGRIQFRGEDVSDVRPDARARLGIWFVQEGHRVFRRLTVEQNLKVMLHGAGYRGSELRQRVRNVYNSIRLLGDRRHLIAGALSGGQQQLLALSAALAIEPKLLLLDEPSAGLAPQVVKECLELIRIAKRAGAAVIIVEQRPDLVVGLCENVLTMENGMVVST